MQSHTYIVRNITYNHMRHERRLILPMQPSYRLLISYKTEEPADDQLNICSAHTSKYICTFEFLHSFLHLIMWPVENLFTLEN